MTADNKKIRAGLCVTGSFCTLSAMLSSLDALTDGGFDLTPIFSFNVASLDTRFYKQADFEQLIVKKTGKRPIKTIAEAEPLGTSSPLDLMIVAPCTGNTLAKLANSITDTPVTMAVKAHLRNNRPVVLSVATNDGLAGSGKNIAKLLNTKNIYFVPFGQDSPFKKPNSLVADMKLLLPTCLTALDGKQLQPILCK